MIDTSKYTHTERLMLLAMAERTDSRQMVWCSLRDVNEWIKGHRSTKLLISAFDSLIERGDIERLSTDATVYTLCRKALHYSVLPKGFQTIKAMQSDGGVVLIRVNYPQHDQWKKLRAKVWERDNYTCVYCGAKDLPLVCDHVLPLSRGGTNEIENLATACDRCNKQKGNFTVEEWFAKWFAPKKVNAK